MSSEQPGQHFTIFHLIGVFLILVFDIFCVQFGWQMGGVLYAILGLILGIPLGWILVALLWLAPIACICVMIEATDRRGARLHVLLSTLAALAAALCGAVYGWKFGGLGSAILGAVIGISLGITGAPFLAGVCSFIGERLLSKWMKGDRKTDPP